MAMRRAVRQCLGRPCPPGSSGRGSPLPAVLLGVWLAPPLHRQGLEPVLGLAPLVRSYPLKKRIRRGSRYAAEIVVSGLPCDTQHCCCSPSRLLAALPWPNASMESVPQFILCDDGNVQSPQSAQHQPSFSATAVVPRSHTCFS